jgi:thiamine-monophosphate kinase
MARRNFPLGRTGSGTPPEHAEARQGAQEWAREWALRWVLTGGEDHSLVATFPPDVPLPPRWTVIGAVREGGGVLVDGRPWAGGTGWDHFA